METDHRPYLLTFPGNYILNYLATRPKMEPFVVQAMVTLFGRLTKLGWFDATKDDFVFRNVIEDVSVFLQARLLNYCRLLCVVKCINPQTCRGGWPPSFSVQISRLKSSGSRRNLEYPRVDPIVS